MGDSGKAAHVPGAAQELYKQLVEAGSGTAPILDDSMPSALKPIEIQDHSGAACGGKFTYYLTVGLDAEAAYR